jgi:hypothetical protein
MMKRRSFLAGLAALPIVGSVLPQAALARETAARDPHPDCFQVTNDSIQSHATSWITGTANVPRSNGIYRVR